MPRAALAIFTPAAIFPVSLYRIETNITEQLCVSLCHFVFYSAAVDILTAGAVAEHAYYVVSGLVKYSQGSDCAPVTEGR